MKEVKSICTVCLIALVFAVQTGCDSGPQLNEFTDDDFPAAPRELQISVGDGRIVLSWSHDDQQNVEHYRVHRRTSGDTSLTLLDTTTLQQYVDSNVLNGVAYIYAVGAFRDGLEGPRALSSVATPTVFGVMINSGDEFTNSRSVQLTMIAPQGTTFMRIANDTLFTNAPWEPYQVSKNWTLAEGDGEKQVYVHYRDSGGNETLSFSQDAITLDTKSIIIEVTENTAGLVKTAGDVIHFSLNAGEPNGNASVDIGQERTSIRLFDDGTNGDNLADDGIYHRDYQVPSGFEVEDASVSGNFSDRLGNVAETLAADGRISIQNAPSAVTLLAPEAVAGSKTSLRLTWTQSTDSDFASYKLYRSPTAGVTATSAFVTSISSANTLSYVDTELTENTTYYYRLFVFDTRGLSSGSNEVSGTPLPNDPPQAVTLLPIEIPAGQPGSLNISWTGSSAADFASYKLYRAEAPGVSTASTLVTSITNNTVLSFLDADLRERATYYYKLYVFDTGGLSAASNEESGTTLENEPPAAVTLFEPVAKEEGITLRWSPNNDNDFKSYQLYRAELPGVTENSLLITTITSGDTTTFLDGSVDENILYFYRLFVVDNGNVSTGSNEVSVTSAPNEPPDPVTLAKPTQVDAQTLQLSWSQTSASDFASYRIYRSQVSPTDTTEAPIAIINSNPATTSYLDAGLDTNVDYYYRVFVFDTSDLSAGSNEVSGRLD